jgi:hypothetical protein
MNQVRALFFLILAAVTGYHTPAEHEREHEADPRAGA